MKSFFCAFFSNCYILLICQLSCVILKFFSSFALFKKKENGRHTNEQNMFMLQCQCYKLFFQLLLNWNFKNVWLLVWYFSDKYQNWNANLILWYKIWYSLKLLDTSVIFPWQYHDVSRTLKINNQDKYID